MHEYASIGQVTTRLTNFMSARCNFVTVTTELADITDLDEEDEANAAKMPSSASNAVALSSSIVVAADVRAEVSQRRATVNQDTPSGSKDYGAVPPDIGQSLQQ